MTSVRYDRDQLAEQRETFGRFGYAVVRGLLAADEVVAYRHEINRVFGLPQRELRWDEIRGKTFTDADGVTKHRAFWPVIFHPGLLRSVRALLGDDIRYTQHSDLHINLGAGRYHRDSAYREFGVGPDWDETEARYRVVRIAIYLSAFDDSGSSLAVLPNSHRRNTALQHFEMWVWNRLRTIARTRNRNDALPHILLTAPLHRIETEPGDCVIIDQRLLHAGGRLRGRQPKYSIFLSYGADDIHSRNHRAYYLKRPTYTAEISDDLVRRLRDANLYREPDVAEHGRPDAPAQEPDATNSSDK